MGQATCIAERVEQGSRNIGNLARRLSLPEAVGLSLAVIAPSITAAFNISLVVKAAGPAAPLTYAIGMIAVALVALSFVAFTRRVAHAGSAYAYITHTFGSQAGFVAGWMLMLAYLCFGSGQAALVGNFAAAFLRRFDVDIGSLWVPVAGATIVLAWWLAYRDMKFAGRLMLAMEALTVLAITALGVRIILEVHPTVEQSLATLRPSTEFHGWAGVGLGMVFTILSFGGFEGAATLGEETINPRRNIPVAMLSTVFLTGFFFIFVSYCEVIGFGPEGLHTLAGSDAPLNELALRFGSRDLAALLDLATAVTAFSGVLGGTAAAARIMFALGRAGLSSKLGEAHPTHGTPAAAVSLVALMSLGMFLSWAPFSGAGNYYSYTGTIGTLGLMLTYIGVGGAETVEASRENRWFWSVICVLGPMVLLWSLYRTLYPVPNYPDNLWPYVTLVWIVVALGLIRLRPALARAPLPDYL